MRHHQDPVIPSFPIRLTHHARVRQQQRGISNDEIRTVLLWGRIYYQGLGRTAYYIGTQEVRRARLEDVELKEYEGIAVVESPDKWIITVIRCNSPSQLKRLCLKERNIPFQESSRYGYDEPVDVTTPLTWNAQAA